MSGAVASNKEAVVSALVHRILVIEDTVEIAQLVKENLSAIARDIVVCADGSEGLASARRERFNLIVLDLMLPGLGGLDICRALRASGRQTPILMLTAKSTELDRIVGLEFGADDYMVKPFSILEFVARVKALLRRTEQIHQLQQRESEQPIHVADLVIDPMCRQVVRGCKTIELTEKEFDLLYLFAGNPGRVYSRSQLLDLVWGCGSRALYEYTVTSHINRLRSKIETDPGNPSIIQTVWGIGYRIQSGRSRSEAETPHKVAKPASILALRPMPRQ